MINVEDKVYKYFEIQRVDNDKRIKYEVDFIKGWTPKQLFQQLNDGNKFLSIPMPDGEFLYINKDMIYGIHCDYEIVKE